MTWFSRAAFWAVWVFVFSIPSERAILIDGVGTISRAIGVMAMACCALAVLLERRVRVPTNFHRIVIVFMLWCGFSVFWSVGLDSSVYRAMTYAQLFAMLLLIWQFAPLQKQVNVLLSAYVLGTLVNAADTLRIFLGGIKGQTQYYQRYASTGSEPNDLSVTLALSVPVSYYLWLQCRERWSGTRWSWVQWIFPIQIVAACMTVGLAASRGGSFTLVLALTIVFWTRQSLTARTRWNLLIVACVGAAILATVVPASSWTRLETAGSELTEGTANGRTRIWQEGWKAFGRAPFQGVGVGAYPDAVVFALGRREHFNPVAHNTFYSVLVETGVIGFLLFSAVLASLITAVWKMPAPHKQVWALTLAVWALGVSSLSWEDRKPMWFVFAMTIAQSEIFRRDRLRNREKVVGRIVLQRPSWREVTP